MPDLPEGYPSRYEVDVVLTDGTTVHVRPIRPDDADAIASLHGRLSAETVYLRFFSPLPTLSPTMLHRFVNVDYADRLALVAELSGQLIDVARYDRLPGRDAAEVAFVVEDAHQHRGIGILLLEHLATAAAERGIRRFVAETLPENNKMLKVFRDAGFGDERRFAEGVVEVTFAIEPTDASVAAMHVRAQRATVQSVMRLLAPRSIAVIGAGRHPGTIGHTVFANLVAGGFSGTVYPVNPHADVVAGVRAYHRVLDIADAVDVAVVVVPAAAVPDVVEECGHKRVGGLIVISSGFADAGGDGAERERTLVAQARGLGMRLIGPNSIGVINTSPALQMNATFTPMPPAGRIGFHSQSGTLGAVVLDAMARRGLGVSSFVATGNKADVSGNDLLQYWEHDPDTDLVLLYLETFGNPRTFARVARRLSRRKPILAVKSGRDQAGEAAVEALFRQTGVIRVDTIEQILDVAEGLICQPLPSGHRVAIVGNAGGPGRVAADACVGAGSEVVKLVELAHSAGGDDYRRELGLVLTGDVADAAIVIFVPPLPARVDEVASAIAEVAAASAKPVLANFLAPAGMEPSLRHGRRRVPSYAYPESAALALGRMADYAEWLRRPEGRIVELAGIERDAAKQAVAAVDGWLDAAGAGRLLDAYGIRTGARRPSVGVDTVVGIEAHESFGPLITFGLGGPAHELLADRASRILPLTDVDAADLVRSIKGAALFFGYQGAAPVDVAALEELLLRVGRMVDDLPEVAELTLAVTVSPEGAVATGVRIRVKPWEPRPDLAMRRLA